LFRHSFDVFIPQFRGKSPAFFAVREDGQQLGVREILVAPHKLAAFTLSHFWA
jgi:hypothetical protein